MTDSYPKNVALGVDQLINTVTGGLPDETISSRVGRAKLSGKFWGIILAPIIDLIFYPFQGWGHCERSIEWDEPPPDERTRS